MCWSSYDRRDRERDRTYRVADRVPAASRPTPAPPVPPVRDPDLRVSQAERDAVVNVLATHYADGRLSLGEYEDRVASALAATTGHDLDALFTDLPGGTPTPTAPAAAAPARPGAPDVRDAPGTGAGDLWRDRSRRGSGFPARVPAVLAVVALAFLAGPWAFFLLIPVLASSSSCGRPRTHHPHRDRDGWDGWGRDDREPVRML